MILDVIQSNKKKALDGQVSMFDFGINQNENDSLQAKDIKYNFNEKDEFSEREILSMEKEMLGIYLSGHPLENLKNQIIHQTTITSNDLRLLSNTVSEEESIEDFNSNLSLESEVERNKTQSSKFKDGQEVIYVGIINSIKKKFTKTNKIMAFITVEDLYGTTEIICFENSYIQAGNILTEENIVLIKGRLSIRDEENATIIANKIENFGEQKRKVLNLNITGISEESKVKLRGAIKYFSGEMNNIAVQIQNESDFKPCGGIYCTEEILKIFEEILGNERVLITEI